MTNLNASVKLIIISIHNFKLQVKLSELLNLELVISVVALYLIDSQSLHPFFWWDIDHLFFYVEAGVVTF